MRRSRVSVSRTVCTLSLAGVAGGNLALAATVRRWSGQERAAAIDWAMDEYFAVSGNAHVARLPMPAHVRSLLERK